MLEKLEGELKSQDENYKKLLADYDGQFEMLTFEKKANFLRNENKNLRESLKTLNEMITKLVEARKTSILSHFF